MRILIYGINYWPELTGVGKYTGEMAEWLAARGHDVRVVTAPPYYPQWKTAEGYSAWRYHRQSHAEVKIQRCPTWIPKKLTLFTRLVHLLSFAITSAPVILWQAYQYPPDVVMVIQPPMFGVPIGWLAAKLARAKAWLHIQDDELEAAFELGFLRTRWLYRLCQRGERFLLNRFDRISSISPRMLNRLEHKGICTDKQTLFPNWVDTQTIFPLNGDNPFRKELGFSGQDVVALYAGNMGRKQGLEILLKVARLLRDHPAIQLVLSGDGSTRRALMEKAAGLTNVRFLPLQPVERLNLLLNVADIHLLIQGPHGANAFMPSKFLGMLASGRPVIATELPDTPIADAIEGSGVLVAPGDSEGLAKVLLELSADPGRRACLGQEGRRLAVAMWHKDTLLRQCEEQLKANQSQKIVAGA